MPSISIIVATYNSEKTLERCIQSIIGQTDNRFELIIIDGKSIDKTIDIVKKHQNDISNWISEKDSGVYDAWNKGIALSRYEWVMFVGSDDVLHKDAVENYLKLIEDSNETLEYISAKVELLSPSGRLIKIWGKPWDWNVFRRFMFVAHVASIHSQKYFEKFGVFNSQYKIAGDYELLLRGGPTLKYKFMDKIVASMSTGGISSANSTVSKEVLKAKIDSGLNLVTCYYDYFMAAVKFSIKQVIGYGK